MQKILAILSLALPLAFGSLNASAAIYYLSDCQAGAVVGCVAGTGAASPASNSIKIN